jgi:hypothetical protein
VEDQGIINPDAEATNEVLDLGTVLSEKPIFQWFKLWLVGTTPIITHAWSHKSKLEMLQKQTKAVKGGKDARDPKQDFVDSLYEMGIDERTKQTMYGFPVTGLKKAIIEVAHKDKGIAKTSVKSGLFLNADIVRVRPALASAMCDMPLVRIYGSDPQMREDMVRIGAGLKKTANLAYRAQFSTWAMKITGRFNPKVLPANALAALVLEAGTACGLGEWRNEKNGVFGAFGLAMPKEQDAWEKFAAGKGPLPAPPEGYAQAAE